MTDRSELAPHVAEEQAASTSEAGSRSPPALGAEQRVAALLSPGDLVIDAGVAFEDQTLLLAILCELRVLVFEPDHGRAELLATNVARAQAGHRVEVRCATLGERTELSGGDSIVALDDVALSVPPRLIRINTGKSALDALRGSEKTIRRYGPLIHIQTATVADLRTALVLLGQWGYVPRGQFGSTLNVFCCPDPVVSQQPTSTPFVMSTPYSALESTALQLRSVAERSESSSTGRADPNAGRSDALGDGRAELARRLETAQAILEQQATQMRRMEAHLLTVKRRLDLLAAAPKSTKLPGPRMTNPRRGEESASTGPGRWAEMGRNSEASARPGPLLAGRAEPHASALGQQADQ